MVYKNPRSYVDPIALAMPGDREETPIKEEPPILDLRPGYLLQTPRGALYLIVAVNQMNCYYVTLNPSTGTICGCGQILKEYAGRAWKLVAKVTIDLSDVEWLL